MITPSFAAHFLVDWSFLSQLQTGEFAFNPLKDRKSVWASKQQSVNGSVLAQEKSNQEAQGKVDDAPSERMQGAYRLIALLSVNLVPITLLLL